jgi:hypothetical protein
MKKILTWLLILQFLQPATLVCAKEPKKFKDKSLYDDKCGEFILLDEVGDIEEGQCFEISKSAEHNTKRQIKHRHSWTPESVTTVRVDPAIKEAYSSTQEVIDALVLPILESRVKANIKEALSLAEEEQDPHLKKEIEKLEKIVFEKGKEKPRHQIRKYLALFPMLKDQILKDEPDLAAVFCQYEVWHQKQEHWQKARHIIGKIANWGGLVGGVAAAILAIPVLPAVLVGISVLKFTTAAMATRDYIARASERQAGRAAKLMLNQEEELQKNLRRLHKELKKTDDDAKEEELEARIDAVEKAIDEFQPFKKGFLEAKQERKEINKALIGAAVNTLVGVSSFMGAKVLYEKLNGFKSEVPDTVIPLEPEVIGGDQGPGNAGDDG